MNKKSIQIRRQNYICKAGTNDKTFQFPIPLGFECTEVYFDVKHKPDHGDYSLNFAIYPANIEASFSEYKQHESARYLSDDVGGPKLGVTGVGKVDLKFSKANMCAHKAQRNEGGHHITNTDVVHVFVNVEKTAKKSLFTRKMNNQLVFDLVCKMKRREQVKIALEEIQSNNTDETKNRETSKKLAKERKEEVQRNAEAEREKEAQKRKQREEQAQRRAEAEREKEAQKRKQREEQAQRRAAAEREKEAQEERKQKAQRRAAAERKKEAQEERKQREEQAQRRAAAERKKKAQKQRNEYEYDQEFPNGMRVHIKGHGPAKILHFADERYKVKYDDGSTYHVEPNQITSKSRKAEKKNTAARVQLGFGYGDDSEDEYDQEFPNGMRVHIKGYGQAKILHFADERYKIKYDDGSTYHVEPNQITSKSRKAEKKKRAQRQCDLFDDDSGDY